jgi:hypothetical protein
MATGSDRVTRYGRLSMSGRPEVGNTGDYFREHLVIQLPRVASAAATGTGVVLPANTNVVGAHLRILTAEATGTTTTVDIGTDTAGDAIFNDQSVAATGFFPASLPPVAASGAEITYTLGSADYAEFEAELLIEIIASDV